MVQPVAASKPTPPQPILPNASRSAVLQPSSGHAFALPPGFQLRPYGLGQRLPGAVQEKMEAVFNADFSDVRVHVGNEAASIGALAFTHGSELYFAPGQYSPTTAQGQRLLGHELTHVVQQRSGRVGYPLGSGLVVVQDAALEAEAERMGMKVATAPAPAAQPNPVGLGGREAPNRQAAEGRPRGMPGPIRPASQALAAHKTDGAVSPRRQGDCVAARPTAILPRMQGARGTYALPLPRVRVSRPTNRGGVIQRHMGMEIEIGMPVAMPDPNATDGYAKVPGDTVLFDHPHYKVVSDSSKRAGRMDGRGASNLEIVMKHFDQHQGDHAAAKRELTSRLDSIDRFIAGLYAVTGGGQRAGGTATLAQVAARVGRGLRVAGGLDNYLVNVDAGPRHNEKLGFVHFTVGYAPDAIHKLINKVLTQETWTRNYNRGGPNTEGSLFRAREAKAVAHTIFNLFFAAEREATKSEHEALTGYLELVYLQVAAFLDEVDLGVDDPESQIKNRTQALSRVPLRTIFDTLPDRVQTWITAHHVDISNAFNVKLTSWNEEHSRKVRNLPEIRLDDYLASALGRNTAAQGADPIPQQHVFGGMCMTPLEQVGSGNRQRLGAALEIRNVSPQNMTREQWRSQAFSHLRLSREFHGDPVDPLLAPGGGRGAPAPVAGRGAPVPGPGRGAPAPVAGRGAPAPVAGRGAPVPGPGRGAPATRGRPRRPRTRGRPRRPCAWTRPWCPRTRGRPRRPRTRGRPRRPCAWTRPRRPCAWTRPRRPCAWARPRRPCARRTPRR